MKTKLNNASQLHSLKTGDVLTKYPTHGEAEHSLNELHQQHADTYCIKSVNEANTMIELVMCGESTALFDLPGKVGRLFIKRAELITQGTWWF